MQTLGDDIVLLALRQDGKFHTAAGQRLRLAVSGAELVELAAARHITIERGRVVVIDPSPTGDARLDAALADIQRSRRAPKASDWVAKQRSKHLGGYLAALAAEGVLRPERRKLLGVLPSVRWPAADPGRVDAARARLDAIALSDEPADAVHAALGGLVHAIGLDKALYPGREGHSARRRLKLVAERDPASGAVHDAVRASVDASVDAAVEASVHAAIHASVHATHHAAAHDAAVGGHGGGGGHH
ncbi:MAG TPA: GPP34 family phosphoprotein [Actinospica sp.]|jgi:hypothetical protein|nr:GPP34 family phosphoprotein [Actinospica sp.]